MFYSRTPRIYHPRSAHFITGPIYYTGYFIVVYMVMVNMFIAIVTAAYTQVIEDSKREIAASLQSSIKEDFVLAFLRSKKKLLSFFSKFSFGLVDDEDEDEDQLQAAEITQLRAKNKQKQNQKASGEALKAED